MPEAREVLDLLDAGAGADALRPLFAPRLEGWDDADSWIRQWVTGLDSMLGPQRRVVSEIEVSSTLTRFHLDGERGTAVATIILDDDGRWFGASLNRRATEGIANIVLQCPRNEDRDAMTSLYDELLQLDPWDVPHLVFDEGRPDDPRPRWPDPAYPQHMHLDIRVGDLEAADALVVARGATRLAEFDDHCVYADIVGHPFCLYPADVPKPVLWRLVIDGRDPDALRGVLRAPPRDRHDADARVPALRRRAAALAGPGVSGAGARRPHVRRPGSPSPRASSNWEARLLHRRDGFPVYADPAGHPFCIGRPGE